jgi:hypothetical protein
MVSVYHRLTVILSHLSFIPGASLPKIWQVLWGRETEVRKKIYVIAFKASPKGLLVIFYWKS